ncbi:hypothetical protein PENVUL_c030G04972 [Penicillium vulpinum]|uniref:Uncharacterized protein n=1 Tax=Penicillium vulpinum TaxID=29845 RepID=A0A1V6RT29_9EURO|nr:hypothetical protein PENVUL_c030G04972 [Penicillium vulpinum]
MVQARGSGWQRECMENLNTFTSNENPQTTVTDQATARALKPWYPGWCQRPCFRVRTVTNRGIVVEVDDQEYDLDALIFRTGYSLGGSADRADLNVTGRDDQILQEKWQKWEASANQAYVLDQLTVHVAHIISEASRLTSEQNLGITVTGVTIEPSSRSTGEWTSKVLSASTRRYSGLHSGFNESGGTPI